MVYAIIMGDGAKPVALFHSKEAAEARLPKDVKVTESWVGGVEYNGLLVRRYHSATTNHVYHLYAYDVNH